MTSFKKHLLAVCVAFLVSIIMLVPHFFLRYSLGGEYQGVPFLRSDAETHYLSQMARSGWGFDVENPYLLLSEKVPNVLYEPLEGFLAVPTRMGVPLVILNLWYKALFPAVCFLLIYALMYRLTNDRLWSVVGGAMVILGYNLFQSNDLLNIIKGISPANEFTRYARPINPQATSLIFFSALLSYCQFFADEKRTSRWALGGIALTLAVGFYSYLYLWIFLLGMGMLAMLFCWGLGERQKCYALGASLGAGILLGIPKMLLLLTYLYHPLQEAVPAELQLTGSHTPQFSLLGFCAVLVYLLWYKKHSKQNRIFLGFLLATAVLIPLQNIVTGVTLQPGHFHWYYAMPIFIMVIIATLEIFLRAGRPFVGVFVPVLLILSSIFVALDVQMFSSRASLPEAREAQTFVPIFDWLREHAQPGEVVLAPSLVSNYLPIFTSQYVVWSDYAGLYLLSPERRAWRGENDDFQLDYIVTVEPLARSGFSLAVQAGQYMIYKRP